MLGHHFPDALLDAIEYLRDSSFDLTSTKNELGAIYKLNDTESNAGSSENDINVHI